MAYEKRIVTGYDSIEKALEEAERKKKWLWIGESNESLGRWVLVNVDRSIKINVGLDQHEFHAFDKAINYILEFLFN